MGGPPPTLMVMIRDPPSQPHLPHVCKMSERSPPVQGVVPDPLVRHHSEDDKLAADESCHAKARPDATQTVQD